VIPLSDDNPTRRAAVAGRTLIVLCGLVFAWQLQAGEWGQFAVRALGFTPANFFAGGAADPQFSWTPFAVPLISYLFLHGGWLHLLGNMLFLWVFGDDVEDAFGPVGFIVFYLLSGTIAALAQGLPDMASTVTVIGASGAVSGLLGAYLVLFPRAQVNVLVPIFFVVDIVRLPAYVVLAFWLLVQVAYEWFAPELGGGVAFRAHIGGFIAGVCMAPLFRWICAGQRRRLPQAQRALVR